MSQRLYFLEPLPEGQLSLILTEEFVHTAPLDEIVTVIQRFKNDRDNWWQEEIERAQTFIHVQSTTISDRRRDRAGFVYLLHSNGLYKIGKANDVTRRFDEISPLLPYPVEIVHYFASADATQAEERLHRRFASKRLRGEWFSLSREDVEYFKKL